MKIEPNSKTEHKRLKKKEEVKTPLSSDIEKAIKAYRNTNMIFKIRKVDILA